MLPEQWGLALATALAIAGGIAAVAWALMRQPLHLSAPRAPPG
jgi:hypothetical protein